MDKRKRRAAGWAWLAALIILAAVNNSWAAQELVIKMATLAPQGTEWHQVLKEMGVAWLITIPVKARTPAARRYGTMIRLPLSICGPNAGPAS